MHPDRDFDLAANEPRQAKQLVDDLALNILIDAMAQDDPIIRAVTGKALLCSGNDIETALYRQAVLRDALDSPGLVRELYQIVSEAIRKERDNFLGSALSRYPEYVLRRAVEVMRVFVEMFEKLRTVAETRARNVRSTGLGNLFSMLALEFSAEYIAEVRQHLARLEFQRGITLSAAIGPGNKATGYALRRPNAPKQNWFERIFAQGPPAYTFRLDPRDESGASALSELRGRGLNIAANALAQSADHVLAFAKMLQTELAFYIGCLNIYDRLAALGEPVRLPDPARTGEGRLAFEGLYDASLALASGSRVVGNDLVLDGADLVIITGANQGGKSTFLRSLGIAQMMMRCGMFVPARSFSADLCDRMFTHFKREEDAAMNSGKLDEELARMSDMVDDMTPGSVVLMNESFAATNEREGSEIGRQIVRALLEKGIRVYYVTHFYDLASSFWAQSLPDAAFLRAEPEAGGRRTFRLTVGQPRPESHAEDLYAVIFGSDAYGREQEARNEPGGI